MTRRLASSCARPLLKYRIPCVSVTSSRWWKGNWEIPGALECYRRVIGLVPGFEPAYIEMGNLLLRHGWAGEALELLQRAMSRGMKSPVIGCLYCKALLLAHSTDQRLPELESRLETAIGADPKWEVPRLLLAEYHLNLKQSSQALLQLEKILALQPHNGEALY